MSCVQTATRTDCSNATTYTYYATARLLGEQCTGDIINKRRSSKFIDKNSSQQSETDEEGNRRFRNTRLCVFHQKGACTKGNDCGYAHSEVELKVAPNLLKTRMCQDWLNGRCTAMDCKFAHGRQELRFTHDYYKTKLCHFWEQGGCTKGALCRHAHGVEELRPMPEDEEVKSLGCMRTDSSREGWWGQGSSPGSGDKSTCTSDGHGDRVEEGRNGGFHVFPSQPAQGDDHLAPAVDAGLVDVQATSRAGPWSFGMRGGIRDDECFMRGEVRVGNQAGTLSDAFVADERGAPQAWPTGAGLSRTEAEIPSDVYGVRSHMEPAVTTASEIGMVSGGRRADNYRPITCDAPLNNATMEAWQPSSAGSCEDECVPNREAFLELAQEARELALRSAELIQKATVLNIGVADPALATPALADSYRKLAASSLQAPLTAPDYAITVPEGLRKESPPVGNPSGSTAYSGSLASGASFASFPEAGVPSFAQAEASRGGIRSMPPPSVPEDVFVPYPLRSGHWHERQKESEGYLDQLAAKLSQFLTTSGGCIDARP